MTYCVAIHTDAGLVFLADSRTNAGVDHISTFRKLTVFEREGERMLVLMTSGNLSISQSVVSDLSEGVTETEGLWAARNMFEAARIVGNAVRRVHERESAALRAHDVDFNISLILGGQIGGERCRLFQIYPAGNFIEASEAASYFQIGESKYGKPILDRVIERRTPLDDAAKCALTSMDSSLRYNISVGLPLDLLVYEADSLRVTHFSLIRDRNPYFRMLSSTWGERLKQVFSAMPNPVWGDAESSLSLSSGTAQPMRVVPAVQPAPVPAPAQVAPSPAPAPTPPAAVQRAAGDPSSTTPGQPPTPE
ncbi:MAG: peptidase [Pigmentiphaga sp.]